MSRVSDRYTQFLSLINFRLAGAEVLGNNGCAGVDGETIGHFALNADRYLVDLCRAVTNGTYRSLPLRQILIPKRDGSWRKLGVPTVRDRTVQQALLNVLHPVLEPQFEPCSFARQRADLAFDLMEEFRSPVVDPLVMKLVNKKALSPTDFTYPNEAGGVYLAEPGRIFLKHFEARISEQTSHPDVQSPVSYRRAIQLQVKRYARAVLGNVGYEPFQR